MATLYEEIAEREYPWFLEAVASGRIRPARRESLVELSAARRPYDTRQVRVNSIPVGKIAVDEEVASWLRVIPRTGHVLVSTSDVLGGVVCDVNLFLEHGADLFCSHDAYVFAREQSEKVWRLAAVYVYRRRLDVPVAV